MSDELGFNKIAGAVLATALAFIGVREVAHAAYHPHTPDVPAYGAEILAEAQAAAAAPKTAEVILPFPQAEWVGAMNAAAGEKVFAKCKSCHGVEAGGPTKTGPNLHGIVGSAAAQRDGFKYSTAMASSGITWNYEELDGYLKKPSRYVKGTAMSFAGLKKPAQRAAVIEYLRVNGSEGLAKPAPAAVPVIEASVPADEAVIQDDPMESKAMEPVEE